MGAWGVKALESDNGLDIIYILESFYFKKTELTLSEIIAKLINEGFLSNNRDDIDFLYDNTIVSLAELIFMFKENGELDYDNEDEKISLRNKTHFHSDKKSLEFILQFLKDIKNEKPDVDGQREYVELWKESDSYEKWKQHIEHLITELIK